MLGVATVSVVVPPLTTNTQCGNCVVMVNVVTLSVVIVGESRTISVRITSLCLVNS